MAGKSDSHETSYLALIFNGTPIANIADNAATSPATSLYVALHTADPTDAGNQSSNEVAYSGYARQAVARNSGGFTVAGNQAAFAAAVSFPAVTSGSGTVTHFSIGMASSGAGIILFSGAVTPNITISAGVTPRLTAGTITED